MDQLNPGSDTQNATPTAARPRLRLPQGPRAVALAAAVLLAAIVALILILRPPTVAIAETTTGTAVDSVYASGVVEYVRQATIAPVVAAPIRAVRVEEGQRVRAGQVLAELVDGPERATALQLGAQAAQARDAARRTQRLFESGYAARATRDDTRRQAEAAEAAARAARERLKDYRIVAPFAGVVIRREAEPGDLAQLGKALFVVADTSALRVTADIDERDAGRLSAGLAALVRSDAFPGQRFDATVASITPQGDATARVFRARLRLDPDTVLKPGMTVEANIILTTRENAVLAPAGAVKDNIAWVVEGGRALQRSVKAGAADAERVEIVSGLKSGERVILNPPETLRDGSRVAAKPAPPAREN
jgi:RND family efflux transporter MFP subunit